MSTDTGFETWVRSELARIAEPVTARPDPYGRLVSRRRLGWLRRGLIGAVAALAAAATGTIIALAPAGAPPMPQTRQEWVDSVLDAPPRGALGADAEFRDGLLDRLTPIARTNSGITRLYWGLEAHPDNEVRLLFADDVAGQRIGIFALRSPVAPTEPGPPRVAWSSGPRGASAEALASAFDREPAPGVRRGSSRMVPFTLAYITGRSPYPETSGCEFDDAACTLVALAPPACQISTSSLDSPGDWTPEPTGSYAVRTIPTEQAGYWRVTCDGVVRQEGPAPPLDLMRLPNDASPERVDDALTRMVGAPADGDPAAEFVRFVVADALTTTLFLREVVVDGPSAVLWGRVSDSDPLDPGVGPELTTVTLLSATPSSRGTVLLGLIVAHREPDGSSDSSLTFVRVDPQRVDISALVALEWYGATHAVAVVAPPGAAAVRLVEPDGREHEAVAVVDRFAALPLARDDPAEGLRVVAYDATGATVATADVLTSAAYPVSENIDNWD